MVDLEKLTVAEALRLAIDALNCVPSFPTSTSNPAKPGTTLTSYQLLPKLEKARDGATEGDVNHVVLVGHLADDPDIRESRQGTKTALMTVVTADKSNAVERHRILVVSEPLVAIVERDLHKGSRVGIEGSLQTRNWVDKKNIERYATEIVVNSSYGGIKVAEPVRPALPKPTAKPRIPRHR